MTRPLIIAGNWKMYKTIPEAVAFVKKVASSHEISQEVEALLAVPFTAIHACVEAAPGSLKIGAQNMHDVSEGAFTGEVAAKMLRDAGAQFVLLGHSERRLHFGETNDFIHKKVLRALQEDIRPILCIGETADVRERGDAISALSVQLEQCLQGAGEKFARMGCIAYEPVWAIGTGKAATKDIVEQTHAHIRALLSQLLGQDAAKAIPLLYGGSVKVENLSAFLKILDVDGVLVGGASLQAEAYLQMLQLAKKTAQEKFALLDK